MKKTPRRFFIEWRGGATKRWNRSVYGYKSYAAAKKVADDKIFAHSSPRIIEVLATEKIHKVPCK